MAFVVADEDEERETDQLLREPDDQGFFDDQVSPISLFPCHTIWPFYFYCFYVAMSGKSVVINWELEFSAGFCCCCDQFSRSLGLYQDSVA